MFLSHFVSNAMQILYISATNWDIITNQNIRFLYVSNFDDKILKQTQ